MSMIPMMMMNPEMRKKSGSVVKYLLLFGALGVGIIAFIFLAKKFNPLKLVGDFFGNVFKGVGDFFGGIFGGIGSALGLGAGSFGGLFTSKKTKEEINVDKAKLYGLDAQKWRTHEDSDLRRVFRRYSKLVIRELDVLKRQDGVSARLAERISMVESAFKKVDKTFVRDMPKQFDVAFNRKRDVLKKGLMTSLERGLLEAKAEELSRKGTVITARRLKLVLGDMGG